MSPIRIVHWFIFASHNSSHIRFSKNDNKKENITESLDLCDWFGMFDRLEWTGSYAGNHTGDCGWSWKTGAQDPTEYHTRMQTRIMPTTDICHI